MSRLDEQAAPWARVARASRPAGRAAGRWLHECTCTGHRSLLNDATRGIGRDGEGGGGAVVVQ